ncbi:MAG: sensor histidine kinase [Actinomycetota bacterium]
MSDIASTLRSRWLEIAWGLFALANIAAIIGLTRWETIPFHFVWVSLTLLYGFRIWRLGSTLVVLGTVMALTTVALAVTVVGGHEQLDELAEVPLMAAMFLAIVWHARRRQAAIEETRRLAENEHHLLEAQRGFVSDASHELRTPITIARGHAELVREAAELRPQTHEDVEVVLDELSRLSRLSERLLILAAAEHPGFLSVSPVDLGPVMAGVERRWQGTADRTWGVRVDEPATVRLDRERFEIALDAVIENAVNATVDGDPIRIEARGDGTDLIVEVADGGSGISEEQLGRIFDRFTRADADRARGGGGTGLGAPIARAIARAHGGDLTARSEPGRDTIMAFRIPGFEPREATSARDRAITQLA